MKKNLSHITSRITQLATAAALFLTAQAGSGAQWVTWEVSAGGNGHEYMAVPKSGGLTWDQAYFEADQIYGGYLATITSQGENNFIFGLINSPQFFTGLNGSGPAIGGYLPPGAGNGQYAWVSGEAWNYTNWYPNRPDGFNVNERNLEFFSGVGNTPGSQWNDINGNDSNIGGYVVERNTVVPEPTSISLLAGCAVLSLALRKRDTRA
jgi:hypothetical protein